MDAKRKECFFSIKQWIYQICIGHFGIYFILINEQTFLRVLSHRMDMSLLRSYEIFENITKEMVRKIGKSIVNERWQTVTANYIICNYFFFLAKKLNISN